MKNNLKLFLVSIVLLPALITLAQAQDVKLVKSVIGNGGYTNQETTVNGETATHSSTLGQTAIEVNTLVGSATTEGYWAEGFWSPIILDPTDVEIEPTTGRSLTNYPNPLRNQTTIEFELDQPANVSIRIYDINGQLIETLNGGQVGSGISSIEWDATDDFGTPVSTGSYLYELSVEPLSGGRSYSLRNVMVVAK